MKKVLIAGLGVTGQAVLDYCIETNTPCVGFEPFSQANFDSIKKKYHMQPIEFYYQELPDDVYNHCDPFILSPGIALTEPWVQKAIDNQVTITGEMEWAASQLKGSLIAVTGTNGKSTTVTLLHQLLLASDKRTSLKGNIGSPLITAISETPRVFYVVEVSSYQIETMQQFHPIISILLNISDDHLERYNDLNHYADTKVELCQNQTADDYVIYNADDPLITRRVAHTSAQLVPFSLVNQFERGGFIDNNEMVIRLDTETRYPLDECSLKGLHNQENMLAALLAAHLLKTDTAKTKQTLKNFKGLSHRLENIGSHKGMPFYDDSKATNVGAVVMSLASFEDNVILILGGKDKGGDYAPLISLIQHKVKQVYLIGEAADLIFNALEKIANKEIVGTIENAVRQSFEIGKPGDTVLLSPACSSFDQYQNFNDRGDDFQKWVRHYAA